MNNEREKVAAVAEEALVVLVSVPSGESAGLARTLVSERLAACVNIIPGISSIYWWEGEVQSDQESLLVIKTTRVRFEALRDRIVELHSYECPEVIAVPITAGFEPYLDWIAASTKFEEKSD